MSPGPCCLSKYPGALTGSPVEVRGRYLGRKGGYAETRLSRDERGGRGSSESDRDRAVRGERGREGEVRAETRSTGRLPSQETHGAGGWTHNSRPCPPPPRMGNLAEAESRRAPLAAPRGRAQRKVRGGPGPGVTHRRPGRYNAAMAPGQGLRGGHGTERSRGGMEGGEGGSAAKRATAEAGGRRLKRRGAGAGAEPGRAGARVPPPCQQAGSLGLGAPGPRSAQPPPQPLPPNRQTHLSHWRTGSTLRPPTSRSRPHPPPPYPPHMM